MGAKERRVLDILANRGELAGLDIVRASDGEIARGSVYGFLARLERTGYVRSRVAPEIRPRNGLPGKKYAVTERGIALIREGVTRRPGNPSGSPYWNILFLAGLAGFRYPAILEHLEMGLRDESLE